MEKLLIEAKDLVKTYGEGEGLTYALNKVSINVYEHDFLVICRIQGGKVVKKCASFAYIVVFIHKGDIQPGIRMWSEQYGGEIADEKNPCDRSSAKELML